MIILLTGITGLVGSHVAMTLLEGGHSVLAIARSRNGVSANKRAKRILESYPEAGVRFGLAGLHVIEGNILEPGCGVTERARSTIRDQVDVVIHCAGDVAFMPASGDSARVNVDGVKNVFEFVREIGCPRLVHVGTAYAEQGVKGMGFRTPYEESKCFGEQHLRDASERGGIDIRIVRPSIVTGDVVYGFTPTYHGIYPFLKYAAEYAGDLKRVSPSAGLPSGFVPDAKINLVPADFVADVIREVACSAEPEAREFNVINPEPWSARDLGVIIARHVGIGADIFSRAEMTGASLSSSASSAVKMLQDAYAPYFDVDLDMDTVATDRLMESAGISGVQNREEWIIALLEWGLHHRWKELG